MSEIEFLENAKRLILEKIQPRKIVLFGSRARGEATSESDFDIFILISDEFDPRESEKAVRLSLMNPDVSWDIILCTESEYKRWKAEGWSILNEIERDGKLLYAA